MADNTVLATVFTSAEIIRASKSCAEGVAKQQHPKAGDILEVSLGASEPTF